MKKRGSLTESKKSQITIQFNWIFVIVVGAILLLFFGSIVTRQREVSETKLELMVSADLGSILAGAAVSTGTFELIDIPQLIINFDCDFYRIGAISKQFKDKIVFGASRLEGKQLITWSLDWNVPFRVSNFLLLTTPDMRFIIADSGSFAQDVYDELPPEIMMKEGQQVPAMSKELEKQYENTFITDKNNFKVRLIFFNQVGSVPDSLKYMAEEDLTALVITGMGFESGIVDFCNFDKLSGRFECPNVGRSKYIGKASLFAAIFSDRVSDYNCLMDKAFTKLASVAQVYAEREGLLIEEYGIRESYCAEAYYKTAVQSEAGKIALMASAGFENADIGSISFDMASLDNRNRQALIASCAQLY